MRARIVGWPAPSEAAAFSICGSSRCSDAHTDSTMNGISTCASATTTPVSVNMNGIGAAITPSFISAWLTTPLLPPNSSAQPSVRATTEISSGPRITSRNSPFHGDCHAVKDVGLGRAEHGGDQRHQHGLRRRPSRRSGCSSSPFCAVSLAIVWGTTLERIKFSAYVIYAVVFGAMIYPIVAHSVWGGGFLSDVGGKPVMDFAGSSVVHLTGAVGGLAALLLLGARRGKYAADGSPRAIPGHSMPFVGLAVMILWIGWFGFNGGSTFGTADSFFGEVMLNTQLAAAAGVIGAVMICYLKTKSLDVGMAGNGAIAGLVGITAPSGFVEYWAAPIIGFLAGVFVVYTVIAIEKQLDDPVGALSAHGMAGIWGTIAVGIFASPRLISDGAAPGIFYGIKDGDFANSLGQLGVQALAVVATFTFVFVVSYAMFAAIKATIGLRVSEEEELAGLDISTHGMYGYPESFIPREEYPGRACSNRAWPEHRSRRRRRQIRPRPAPQPPRAPRRR